MQDKINKPVNISYSMIWVSLGLGTVYWIVDAVITLLTSTDPTFLHTLLGIDNRGFWLRWIVCQCLFVIFGSHVQYTVKKRRESEDALRESEERYRGLFTGTPDGIIVHDADGLIFDANEAMAQRLEISREVLLGRHIAEFITPDNAANIGDNARITLAGQTRVFETTYVSASGKTIPAEVHESRIQWMNGQAVLSISRDITERQQAEEALKESEGRYRALIEKSPDTHLIIDNEGNYVDCNQATLDMLRMTSKEQLMGLNPVDLSPERQPDGQLSREKSEAMVAEIMAKGSLRYEWVHRKADGEVFPANVLATVIKYQGKTLLHSVWRDITDRKRAEEALTVSEKKFRELSIIDELTSLYNSRHFYSQIKIELERSNRYEQHLTLLLLDLDNFKAFNDAYGHVEGDQVLRRLGQVIKRCLRETDFAYRYGGEEFTILLPMTTSADGAVTAERIRAEFKKEIFSPVPGQEVHLTVSIGLAQYRPQEDMKAFIHRVDKLMYQGKKNGKDRICSES